VVKRKEPLSDCNY